MGVSVITIVLFFIYLWGFGFSATYFLSKPTEPFERHLLNIAVGLGVLPILLIFFNFLHIPLDWKILLILSIALPTYSFVQRYFITKEIKLSLPKLSLKFKKSNLALLVVLLIALSSFYMYTQGAFSYPFLEDEDPWGHAVGVKYVALEKTAYDPELYVEGKAVDPTLSYIDPYPPAYDIFMGILHQTSPDMMWTLKFFNALIISLGLIFFYLFANILTNSRKKALFATLVLAVVPSYFSHFIWAHTLVVVLFFPAMYAFEKIREDAKWTYIALLIVASIWVSQNLSQPIKLSSMILLYLIVISIAHRKFFYRKYTAFIGGIALSTLWWGVMIKKYTLQGFLQYFTGDSASVLDQQILGSSQIGGSSNIIVSLFTKGIALIKKITAAGGSGSRVYTFEDFFVAKGQNMINNPIGLGKVLTILVLVTIVWLLWKHRSAIVEKKNAWIAVTLFWLIFTFWGVMGKAFPISVARGTFRVWMLLAIPISLIAAEGFSLIIKFFGKQKALKFGVGLLLIIGLLLTSGVAKYELNTAQWPTSGSFTNQNEPYQYGEWFGSIPLNTKVFLYSPRDKLVIGYGAYSCAWCQEVVDFREEILFKDSSELHTFLKAEEYEYLLINPFMDSKYFSHEERFGAEDTQRLLPQRYQDIIESGLFTPVHQVEDNFLIFSVN